MLETKKTISKESLVEDKTPEIVILQQDNKKESKIVCAVCGYANPEYTAICKNCSNYLN